MDDLKAKKILIAYFSHKGGTYFASGIADVKVGNTQIVAQKIAEQTEGTLFEIVPKNDYPKDYRRCTMAAKEELEEKARPALAKTLRNPDSYDVILLGYPNWWGTCPMPVFTFLAKAHFEGKIILPFCTNEGSGLGNSVQDLKAALPTCQVLSGLAIRGSQAPQSDQAIADWLKEQFSKIE
jgi:flavodoxin